jgi:PRTRC genetic system protein A
MGIRKYYWRAKEFLSDNKKKPVSVIASRTGQLFEIRELFIGRLVHPAHDIHELDDIEAGFKLAIPKIPGQYLEQIISFFRDYCDKYETEVLMHIYMDTHTNRYILECPYQVVNKHLVNNSNYDPLDPKRYKKIMDLHSHNTMEAYFSPTDNADEVNPILFGVIGRLDREPTMVYRVGVNGYFIELPVTHLFTEFDVNNHVPYPDEWKNRVVIKGES